MGLDTAALAQVLVHDAPLEWRQRVQLDRPARSCASSAASSGSAAARRHAARDSHRRRPPPGPSEGPSGNTIAGPDAGRRRSSGRGGRSTGRRPRPPASPATPRHAPGPRPRRQGPARRRSPRAGPGAPRPAPAVGSSRRETFEIIASSPCLTALLLAWRPGGAPGGGSEPTRRPPPASSPLARGRGSLRLCGPGPPPAAGSSGLTAGPYGVDQVLLADRPGVRGDPVDRQTGRIAEQEDDEDQRQEQHQAALVLVGKGRRDQRRDELRGDIEDDQGDQHHAGRLSVKSGMNRNFAEPCSTVSHGVGQNFAGRSRDLRTGSVNLTSRFGRCSSRIRPAAGRRYRNFKSVRSM